MSLESTSTILNDLPFPPELQKPPPREVRLKPDAILKNLFTLGLMGIMGLYSAAVILFFFCEIAFQLSAPVVQGFVVDTSTHPGPKGGTWYAVTYQYTVSGVIHSNSQTVSESYFEHLLDGGVVPISTMVIGSTRYDEIHISADEYFQERGIIWAGSAVTCGLIIFMWRRSQLVLCEVVRSGEATVGIIESKKSYSTRNGKSYVVKYRFKDSQGQVLEGATMRVSEADYDLTLVGDRMVVLYDPLKPSRNLIYQYGPYGAV
jgi:hypothetical protein